MDEKKGECVFCQIISGELPCYRIDEDEHTLVFLDIAKDIDGHMVVIPKRHASNLMDCEEEILGFLMKTVRRISRHLVENCGYDGVNLLHASGRSAGQSVGHFHLHLIPRKQADGEDAWPSFTGAKQEFSTVYEALKMQ